MSEVDFFVKLRDASAMILDACESRLEQLAPVEVREDFDKLFWEEKKGDKGPFQQTSERANNNSDLWKKLKARVKEHGGFWQNQGFRFWFDLNREDVVDRRKIA